ncbi:MAG: hypothetical protein H6668_12035 [Ardenticatenaceae bacterium]|nr:hypothetical protein [Ardenticatenaceae bacterium]
MSLRLVVEEKRPLSYLIPLHKWVVDKRRKRPFPPTTSLSSTGLNGRFSHHLTFPNRD